MKNTKIKSYSEWRKSIIKKAILIPFSACVLIYLVANMEYGVSLTIALLSTIFVVGSTVLFSSINITEYDYEVYKRMKQEETN